MPAGLRDRLEHVAAQLLDELRQLLAVEGAQSPPGPRSSSEARTYLEFSQNDEVGELAEAPGARAEPRQRAVRLGAQVLRHRPRLRAPTAET